MNQEHEPDIYGFILLKYDGQLYIADIQWETIAAYDRRGISWKSQFRGFLFILSGK